MSSVTNVGIKLTLDGAQQAEAGLRRVQGGMEGLGRTAESVRGAMQQLAGAFAGVVSVRAFVQAADAVTQLQNQLRLATGSTQAATAAYQKLFEIAQRSRVSFTELGGTFASIARATESLGLSQQQLLRLTETIGNAITVSGSSAAASQAALVQLSQGLASGVLRGEELNSILEQTPRLARALADGLGVSVGQLRKLGEEGKLTAEAVIAALQSQASVLANEVQNSVVTVGQAFTQVQNSAIKLVGEIDRVSGSSTTLAGALQAASESLDNISRAFRDTQSAGQQVNVFADAIAVVFETVAVLGVNVAYVIKQIGTEIGGLAAQAAAVARLDFSAAREIGRLMREDAAAARREVDALSDRILNQRRLAEQARQSLQGVDTRAEDARLARYAQAGSRALSTVTTAAATAKKGVDEFAKSVERGVQLYGNLTAQGNGLAANFAEQWQNLANAYKAGKINLEQLTAAQALLLEQQPFAKELAKEQAEALKQQAKAAEDLAKAEFERIEALERSAESAEGQLQRLLDEEKAVTIAAEKNITLAQALEEVAIARLRERQAALMAEGDRDAEVLAIQREIDARKKLAEAIGRKEARDAAAESAKEAAREWERTAENIERSLTDALLRGFESGKDFARNLRDTVVNMFKSLVLRPVIQAVVAPVAGAITGALGLPGQANAATGGPGALGMASSLKSIYDTIVGGFTALGNSVAFAAQDIGAWLVNNTTGVLNKFGSTLMSNAGALGTVAEYLGGIGAGIGLGNLISGGYQAIGGKYGGTLVTAGGTIAGAAIGAKIGSIGGPLGAVIGGAVGGLANRAFGRKLADQGIEGTFGDDGFTGNSYQFYKGGWFRSNKTKRSALDPELDQALDQQFMAIKTTVLGLGEVLGVARTALDGFTQSIKLSFKGLDEQQIQEKLNEVFNGIGESMARSILAGDAFIKEGETAQQALVRLAGSLQVVNAAFDTLGRTMLEASLKSGDIASKLIEAFGGVEQFTAATNSYYQNFYTDAERLDTATRQLRKAFADIGVEMPATKEAFRALVEAQDLTTESGRKTYAALLQLSGAFAELQNKALQLFGLSRDALVQQFTEGLMSGDATAAGMAVADTVVASIERAMIANGAAAIFDIVNAGIITPILDALIKGQAVSEALSAAAIEATVQKVNAAATALGQLLNDPAFKKALDGLRDTLTSALSGAAKSINYTPRYQVPRLEEARRAAEAAARAQEEYNRALEDARSRLSAAENAVRSAQDRVRGVQERATSEYISAQDRVAAAQERVNEVLRQQYDTAMANARALREMGRSLKEFVLGQTGNAQQVFADVLRRALAGDQEAMRALPDAARSASDQARMSASTSEQARIAQARILADVLRVANMAQATPDPVAPNVPPALDDLAQAQAELAAAQSELAEALRVANAINAPLTQSVTDLIAEYRAAMAELAKAQAEYAEALRVLRSIEGNTGQTSSNTSAALLEFERARLQIVDQLVNGFTRLDTNLDGFLNFDEFKSAFSGLASDETLRSIFALLDVDGDRVISQLEAVRVGIINSLASNFSKLDTNLDEFLNFDEFKSAFSGLASEATLRQIFAELDINGDGTISRLEAIQSNTKAFSEGVVFNANDPLRSVFNAIKENTKENLNIANAMFGSLEAIRINTAATGNNTFEIRSLTSSVVRGTDSFKIRGATTAFAQGGVFTNGLVDRPTMFSLGLMGEAGPEAIMPLKRRPDGTLGVVAEVPDLSRYGRTDNAEVVAEIRALRSENAAQARAIVQLQQRFTRIIERWDGNGLPEQRVVA